MEGKNRETKALGQPGPGLAGAAGESSPDGNRCLDTVQLTRLEEAFRQWLEAAARPDVRLSRKRIVLIFLLIRYTGAKLNEVLALNPFQDLAPDR